MTENKRLSQIIIELYIRKNCPMSQRVLDFFKTMNPEGKGISLKIIYLDCDNMESRNYNICITPSITLNGKLLFVGAFDSKKMLKILSAA